MESTTFWNLSLCGLVEISEERKSFIFKIEKSPKQQHLPDYKASYLSRLYLS
jgi:hypothetical protein